MRKLLVSLLVGVFLAGTSVILAQGDKSPLPKDKIALGVKMNDINLGASFSYAIQPNIHLGAGFGVGIVTGTDNAGDDGGTVFNFNPFFRYILSNEANLFPYIEANLAFYESFSLISPLNVQANSLVNVEFGGFWFPFPSVSVRGGVNVVNFNIDNSRLKAGILEPFMGIDWWF